LNRDRCLDEPMVIGYVSKSYWIWMKKWEQLSMLRQRLVNKDAR